MTSEEELESVRERVDARTRELHKLYVEMLDIVRNQMDQQRTMTKAELKEVNVKLGELQTLQLSLLRAEETLHDQLRSKSSESTADYDAIRRTIGRAIDRLRGEVSAEAVSGGAARSSD